MLIQIQIFRSWDSCRLTVGWARRNFFSSDLTEKYLIFRAFWVTFSKHFSVKGKTSPPHHADFWWDHASAPPPKSGPVQLDTYIETWAVSFSLDV